MVAAKDRPTHLSILRFSNDLGGACRPEGFGAKNAYLRPVTERRRKHMLKAILLALALMGGFAPHHCFNCDEE